MSSLASGASTAPHRQHTRTVTIPWAGPGGWLSLAVAGVILLATFVARGGVRLEPTTNVEIGLMLLGGGMVALACVAGPRPGTPARLYGIWVVIAFGLLAVYTAVSLVWSLAPSDTWAEANRAFAYLAVLAGSVALVRLVPGRWAELLYGVLTGTVLICGWALLTKVFPHALAADEQLARLRAPFEYWNSVGLTAALAVPVLMWMTARRSASPVINTLAWPLLGLVWTCLMLSYSRGSLIALGIGLAVWLAAVPLRLRAVAALIGSALAAAPVVLWAFAQDGLTVDKAPMAARADAGHELGALLLLLIAVLTAAGLAVSFFTSRQAPSERTRRHAGIALLAGLGLVPIVVLIVLAASPGGISGQTGDAWNRLVDPQARTPGNTPDRLAETSSVRARYWDEALKVHAHSTLVGTGAGAYATVRNRYRENGDIIVRHAHGYGVQTLSDLGWVGIGLSLLAALAWVLTAARALGMRRRDRGLPFDAQRVALWTMAVVVVTFAVHSAIDWTWFVPGNVVPVLLCAGWVAGRGPLRTWLDGTAATTVVVEERRHVSWLPRWSPPPWRLGAALLAIVAALAGAWAAYQPVRSVHAGDAALDRLDRGAVEAAASIAQIAVDRNPYSVDALFELAAIEQARTREAAALKAYGRAIDVQPASAETWRQRGRFYLDVADEPKKALDDLQVAYYLDPQNRTSWIDLIEATRAVQAARG